MNINACFPSKYIKSEDLLGRDVPLQIREIKIEDVGGDGKGEDVKPVVYFYGTNKGLVLNKTNAEVIAGLYTPETDAWIGRAVTLYATEVSFGSKTVLGLRVRMTPPVQMTVLPSTLTGQVIVPTPTPPPVQPAPAAPVAQPVQPAAAPIPTPAPPVYPDPVAYTPPVGIDPLKALFNQPATV